MKILLKSFLLFLFVLIAPVIHSQNTDHDHDHHKFELGLANSCVYFANEKEFAYGLHLHLVRKIEHSKFGYGLAYERIFDEHRHNTVGVVGSYNPVKSLHVNVAPGVAFEDHEPSELKFAFHVESSYDFDLNNIHIGPLIELAFDPDEYHISFGLHIGYGF